jgi:hypothetical protein
LDVGLDVLECNLDSFLHETCLLAKFSCPLWKLISPSYDIVFGWKLIGHWVRNPKKLSLHQLDFCSSRYWILNGQRSTLTECEIWLCRMWFPWSFSFYFSCITFAERYGCYIFSATGITSFRSLELTLCTKHRLNVKSANYLQFTPFYIFHPKVPSKHKTKNIKVFYIYNMDKILSRCG